MCELLGIVASHPADVTFSFTGFAQRGGRTGPHADGWGLTLYEGNFARTFREHHPAFSSPLARFLRENPILTQLAVAHIRKATRGVASIQNTHPFVRIWHRRHLTFAHNGTLPNVKQRPLRYESTLGDTDSEYAFCVMVEMLREAYGPRYPENPAELGKTLYEIANELGRDGMFNFLFADGEHLYARCGDSLYRTEHHRPEAPATLADGEVKVKLGDIHAAPDVARIALVATKPLTDAERWRKADAGMLWVFSQGELITTFDPPPGYRAPSSIAPPWQPA